MVARVADYEKQMKDTRAMIARAMAAYVSPKTHLLRDVSATVARAVEAHQYWQKHANLGFPNIIRSGLSIDSPRTPIPEQRRTSLLEPSLAASINEAYEKITPEIFPDPSSSPELVPITRHEKVFIVHGHDHVARDAVECFVDNWGLTPIVLDAQPNKGRTIIEKFEQCANKVSFAIVLFTPDDVGASQKNKSDLKPRARQNVIFELGYFIKALGWQRVCILYEEGVELPSDIQGIVYIPMDDAGRWRQKVIREMMATDLLVDMDKIF